MNNPTTIHSGDTIYAIPSEDYVGNNISRVNFIGGLNDTITISGARASLVLNGGDAMIINDAATSLHLTLIGMCAHVTINDFNHASTLNLVGQAGFNSVDDVMGHMTVSDGGTYLENSQISSRGYAVRFANDTHVDRGQILVNGHH